jgi:hypothetical protein
VGSSFLENFDGTEGAESCGKHIDFNVISYFKKSVNYILWRLILLFSCTNETKKNHYEEWLV